MLNSQAEIEKYPLTVFNMLLKESCHRTEKVPS